MIDTEFEQHGEAFRAFSKVPLNVLLSPTHTITMEQKTILEWFRYAKEQGYEWADKAIKNTDKADLYETTKTMQDAVIGAFKWSYTDEGFNYWNLAYKSLTVKTQ